MADMESRSPTPVSTPRVVHIALDDLERPPLKAPETEEIHSQTRATCHAIFADLKCVQLAYVFKPKHFDRDTIHEHLKEVLSEYYFLRANPSHFATHAEYEHFLKKMYKMTTNTMQIIRAAKHRDELRQKAQEETVKELVQRSQPRHVSALPPWSQFLASGAPSLPVAHFLAPFPTRPPTDVSYPTHRQIKATSIQALPQAATMIMHTWGVEFRKLLEFYHLRYPRDKNFFGSMPSKILPYRQMLLTPGGLKVDAFRSHNLGNRPYASAIEKVNGQGCEEKAALGKFAGMLQEKEQRTALAANRLYLIRKWVLEETMED